MRALIKTVVAAANAVFHLLDMMATNLSNRVTDTPVPLYVTIHWTKQVALRSCNFRPRLGVVRQEKAPRLDILLPLFINLWLSSYSEVFSAGSWDDDGSPAICF